MNLGQVCQNTFLIPQLLYYKNYYKDIVEESVLFCFPDNKPLFSILG